MHIRSAIAGAGATVVAVGVAFAAVSAGNATEPASVPVVEETVPVGHYSTPGNAFAAPTMTRDSFLATIKGLLSEIPHAEQTDAEYVNGGRSVCADFDDGATWDTYSDDIASIGGDLAFYRAAVRASIYTFCPKHAIEI